MAVIIQITNAGRAALVNAPNTGTNPILIAQVGLSASAITPSPSATSLTGEHKRLSTLSGAVVADDTIHLTVRDESSDTFTVRSFGLYLADGTLFAIYGQAPVLVEKSAQSMMLLAIDIKFADIAAAALTFGDTDFLLPPATHTVQGVVELATEAEMISGVDDSRVGTPKGIKAAVINWLNARFGENAPSPLMKTILAHILPSQIRSELGLGNAALKNEGAGNGLDADLLDGQQGAWYSNITARLGFTPLNAASYTAADVLAKLLTVDGAGSGVDADLLDGQQGSYYTNIIARLGFTPLNATSYTAADVLAKLLTVDGAGSGMDADMLDGQQSNYYTDIIARLGFSPVQQGTGIGQFNNAIKLGWDGSRLKGTVDSVDLGPFVFANHIADVWRASNDGSGSGLDADLLDGAQLSELVKKIDFSQTIGESGYQILPSGLIVQWGWGAAFTNQANSTVTFPLAFPNAAFRMFACLGTALSLNANNVGCGAMALSKTQGRISIATPSPGTIGCHWLAIGY